MEGNVHFSSTISLEGCFKRKCKKCRYEQHAEMQMEKKVNFKGGINTDTFLKY